jgi:1-acyl-sn-glycerol-3-phosphate acyltransferase
VKKLVRRLAFPVLAPSVPAGVEPPERKPTSGIDFDTDWARKPAARVARRALHELVVEPVVRFVADPTVEGVDRLEALDEDRPVIFAANHHSHVDTPLLLRRLPAPWRNRCFVAAAADYFFPNRVTAVASALALNAIPIERQRVNRRSALDAAALLDRGWSMLIYPEGGRSPDGWGQPFRGGAAYLAIRCGVPVVPVHVAGTDRILPKGRNLPRPGSTTITVGSPLQPAEGEDARRMGVRIEEAVAALADEHATDWWQARRRAHAGRTPSLSGPDAVSWRRAWALSAKRHGRPAPRRAWPEL